MIEKKIQIQKENHELFQFIYFLRKGGVSLLNHPFNLASEKFGMTFWHRNDLTLPG